MNNLDPVQKQNRYTELILLLLVFFSIINYSVNGIYSSMKYKGGDFINYYVNGKLLISDINIYDDIERETAAESLEGYAGSDLVKKYHPPSYPPFWYLVISSLSFANCGMAFNLFLMINQLFLIGSIYYLFKYFKISLISIEGIGSIFLILNFYPLWYNMAEGQVNVLLLFLILWGLWNIKNHKDLPAGILFGLAAGIKIVPGFLLLYFLLKRQFKVVLYGIASFIGTILIPMIIIGPKLVIDYFLTSLKTLPEASIFNQSINGFIARLFTNSEYSNGWMDNPELSGIVTLILVVFVFTATIYLSRGKFQRCSTEWNLGFSYFILAMLLMSSWTLEHHFVLLYILWFSIVSGCVQQSGISLKNGLLIALLFAILAISIPYTSAKFNTGIFIMVKSLKFYMIAALWIIIPGLIKNTVANGNFNPRTETVR